MVSNECVSIAISFESGATAQITCVRTRGKSIHTYRHTVIFEGGSIMESQDGAIRYALPGTEERVVQLPSVDTILEDTAGFIDGIRCPERADSTALDAQETLCLVERARRRRPALR